MFDGTAYLPEEEKCELCGGSGGYDTSQDCESYDDWQECPRCQGSGLAVDFDDFLPKRDAWTPND